jgi:hypothetical protein
MRFPSSGAVFWCRAVETLGGTGCMTMLRFGSVVDGSGEIE